MFELREFLKKGILDAVGRKPTYWVVLNAAGWLEKGVLLEEDLKEIDEAIEAKNAAENAEENTEEHIEENAEEHAEENEIPQ